MSGIRLLCALAVLSGCSDPPRAPVADEAPLPRIVVPSDSSREPGDLVDRCAYSRDDGEYLGRIVDAGPLGYRNMPGERRVLVESVRRGRLALTYPRNIRTGSCPRGARE